jgi:AraC family transcriptional regulator, regulatory protein of adaptative response / DNA-3-methyladenine glycosylase II
MTLDHDLCYRIIKARDSRYDGKIFTGVKTTGIYCRPICPASVPLQANVDFYPSAAAAQEAGFRPCLRCRPETAPDTGAWLGTSATVSRALRLIEDGALDEGSVASLALRLGMGERQLRRLFLKHVGAPPVAVAQTRRMLLAKQLLHDTDLPMAEVALASGYQSIRRFNEAFQALFQRPPSQLRRAVHKEGSPSGGHIKLGLRYRPPYDWDAMLAFLSARLIRGVETLSDGIYRRTFDIGGQTGTVAVTMGARNCLTVWVDTSDLKVLPQVIARVRRQFDLGADTATIEAALSEDPVLAACIAARPGLRVPGAWDPFETAVRAVLGQQVSVKAGLGLVSTLATACGKPLSTAHPGLTHCFPSPQHLAQEQFDVLAMPQARKRALSVLCAAVADKPDLFKDHHEGVQASLLGLAGIGPWTASYIALRALRDPDAFPSADVGLMRALALPDGTRLDTRAMEQRSQSWRPWRAYAAQHLWMTLEPGQKERPERAALNP